VEDVLRREWGQLSVLQDGRGWEERREENPTEGGTCRA